MNEPQWFEVLLRLEYKNRLRENQQSTSIIYTQASTNKILIASDFCFLQKKKNIRVKIYQKNVMEMFIL